MKYIQYMMITITVILVLIGCARSQNSISSNIPSKIYAVAQKKLQDGNFKGAIKQLELLDNCYPCGPYAQQVQLDLIYAYYKTADLPTVEILIDRFMHLNPTYPDNDYVLYMRGLSNMERDNNELQVFFGINYADHNPEYANQAFQDFSNLIHRYPDSKYRTDSIKRLIYLQNRLADYEKSIAEYYNKHGAYIASINRIETMLRNYPNTQATRSALQLLYDDYNKIGLKNQANKVAQIIP
ncbi:Outer membrane protein assembly factor BamD [Candidatus Profftia lariciata]|uniref:outer membrane protein assembly factor BamD n=1 Tax=Candidatus Profftia lariciata TaxID=1987921 RepID=UPI001D030774|nr:outer membrane protein assembly factor BamD [Candidatus Profftia lariciata]UDG81424.1 Outer membrane protein assembly factor BamD [Candidatus Profftia lariciata]